MWVSLREIVSDLNLVTFIFRNFVGNNAFKYGRPHARPGYFKGIANIDFLKQKVPRFECGATFGSVQTVILEL